MTLHLVRHGPSAIDPAVPPHEWQLDPAGYDLVWALRERLPRRGAWFSSPEPKALATAQLLTDSDLGVIDDLVEHRRDSTTWFDDHGAVVRRAFAHPDEPAHPGWEPLSACRRRLQAAVPPLLQAHRGEEIVLVGHGTAWTVLVAELTGQPPDLQRWQGLAMPDLIVLDEPAEASGRWSVRANPPTDEAPRPTIDT